MQAKKFKDKTKETKGAFIIKYSYYKSKYIVDLYLATGGACIIQFINKSATEANNEVLEYIAKFQ